MRSHLFEEVSLQRVVFKLPFIVCFYLPEDGLSEQSKSVGRMKLYKHSCDCSSVLLYITND